MSRAEQSNNVDPAGQYDGLKQEQQPSSRRILSQPSFCNES
jgi:hypothetical protein